jgi:hypothetical protein
MFAHWAIFFLWPVFEVAQIIGEAFSRSTSYVLIFSKKWLGHTLGDFFRKLIWSPCHAADGYLVSLHFTARKLHPARVARCFFSKQTIIPKRIIPNDHKIYQKHCSK